MGAIYKREISSYFKSAIGYIFFTVFAFFSGLFFVSSNLNGGTTDMSAFYTSLIIVYVILIPLLTMKLMSEERRQKTDQALLTAPVGLLGIALGKFFAAFTICAAAVCSTAVYAIIYACFGTVQIWVILGSIVGMVLLGGALIAIGIFVSSLTESQVVAAVGTFAIIFFLLIIQALSSIFTSGIATKIINMLSILERYGNFAAGLFDISDAVYYFSIAAVFIFLTVRAMEKRRWS